MLEYFIPTQFATKNVTFWMTDKQLLTTMVSVSCTNMPRTVSSMPAPSSFPSCNTSPILVTGTTITTRTHQLVDERNKMRFSNSDTMSELIIYVIIFVKSRFLPAFSTAAESKA